MTIAGQVDGFVWQLRVIARAVVARPMAGAAALALVAVGLFGHPYLSIPDVVDVVLFLSGALSLLYLARTTGS